MEYIPMEDILMEDIPTKHISKHSQNLDHFIARFYDL